MNTFGEAFHIGQEIDCKTKVAFYCFTHFIISGLGYVIFAFVYLPNAIIINEKKGSSEKCVGDIRRRGSSTFW